MCTYQYHIEFNELKCGLNILQARKHVHDRHYVCSCEGICKPKMNNAVGEFSCSTHTWTYNMLTSLWSSLLCSKEQNDEFHKRDYIIGNCPMCGIKLLQVCLEELFTSSKTQWCSISYEVIGKTYNGQDKKINKVMYNNTKPFEFIKYFKSLLSKFVVQKKSLDTT